MNAKKREDDRVVRCKKCGTAVLSVSRDGVCYRCKGDEYRRMPEGVAEGGHQ